MKGRNLIMVEQNENKEEKKVNWFIRWWNSLDSDFRNIVYITFAITGIIFIIIFIGAIFLPNDNISYHIKTLDYNGHRYVVYDNRGITHDPDCLCHYKRITDK